MGTLVLAPLAVIGCGWLAQRQGTLVLFLGALLVMVVLCVAWAMCGAVPGTCVAVCGFAFMLFVGPALSDYVMDHRGVRHDAVIGESDTYYKKHGDGRTCTVIPSGVSSPQAFDVDGTNGCTDDLKAGQRVTLVVDPEGWLAPRLSGSVTGVSPSTAWTCAGLFAAMEAFILYGRPRRRRS